MSKKHEMTEHEYQIFKKQHTSEDLVDTEQGKIEREKAIYIQNRRKGTFRLLQDLRSIVSPDDVEEVDADLEQPEEEHIAERVRRNARTHKQRLVRLRKHETENRSGGADNN
jgi:hypothetical protein